MRQQLPGSLVTSTSLLMVLSLIVKPEQVTVRLRCFPLRRLTHFEFCLALPVLYTSTWNGSVVDYISLSKRVQRSKNKPAFFSNKKASERADGGNDVYANPKYSTLGGSDLFAITNCFSLIRPCRPLGIPPLLLSLMTGTLLPHWEEEGTTRRRQK